MMTQKIFSCAVSKLIIIPFAFLHFGLLAQNKYRFEKGLYLQITHSYGREAVYSDEFLWNYYNGTFIEPKEGKSINGKQVDQAKWTFIQTDTSGFFRPSPGMGGNLRNPNNPAGPGRIEKIANSTSTQQNANPRRGLGPTYLYLTYNAKKAQAAILNIKGNSAVLINGELHSGDPYRMGWLNIPVQLKKGLNEFYVRGILVQAELSFPTQPAILDINDATLPDIVLGKNNSKLLAGVVVINNTSKNMYDLNIENTIEGSTSTTPVPVIPAYSTRKISVQIDASKIVAIGSPTVKLGLFKKGKLIDQKNINLRSVSASTPYRHTFTSEIDGSLQYFAVNPATGGEKSGDALFFSVHGAGVEALGQAQAYHAKDWGTLVAPTNRRPRGFNWEDWGRLDALEVLALAKQTLKPDTQRVYLTGHSMGGHGTWFLGATYPDKWAAIAPCAGYPTLKGYGSADGLIPEKGRNEMENILLRSSNQSDVIAYTSNYKPLGIYVLHGDADRTVPISYARQMRNILGEFHPDFSYYEYPGGSHWYSNESVDWKPMFDYFKWHKRKVDKDVNKIDFKTANPGISASYYWATIYQQEEALSYSHIQLTRDLENNTIQGRTDNLKTLALNLDAFPEGQHINIMLDSLSQISYQRSAKDAMIYLRKAKQGWQIIEKPSPAEKGPHRNGMFKEAFNHNMVYVYGTKGTPEENKWAIEKAKYDAESWYYRGNGSFDIIADTEFDTTAYANRNIILIGNSQTNCAWNVLLTDCPISVTSSAIKLGVHKYEGNDLGGYFIWKKQGSNIHTIGIITGTGIKGMKAATANQYFAGASGFPDYMFFKLDMLKYGPSSLIDAGFYTNDWLVE
ncbi:MAG: prolyl oligopeptidase family serine peptidase [Sphingobacterium sp.]